MFVITGLLPRWQQQSGLANANSGSLGLLVSLVDVRGPTSELCSAAFPGGYAGCQHCRGWPHLPGHSACRPQVVVFSKGEQLFFLRFCTFNSSFQQKFLLFQMSWIANLKYEYSEIKKVTEIESHTAVSKVFSTNQQGLRWKSDLSEALGDITPMPTSLSISD